MIGGVLRVARTIGAGVLRELAERLEPAQDHAPDHAGLELYEDEEASAAETTAEGQRMRQAALERRPAPAPEPAPKPLAGGYADRAARARARAAR